MYKRINECYVPYEPSVWNSNPNLTQSHNCYSYFLNDINNDLIRIYKQNSDNIEIQKSLNPQPGHYCGMTKYVEYKDTTCPSLNKRILCDNPSIKIVNKDDECDEGYYKGALFIDEGRMYHFYRQDDDGNWSHKDGGMEVTNLDSSGEIIKDVMNSDRRYISENNIREYNKFCSYYCVPENHTTSTRMARNNHLEGKLWWKSL